MVSGKGLVTVVHHNHKSVKKGSKTNPLPLKLKQCLCKYRSLWSLFDPHLDQGYNDQGDVQSSAPRYELT